MKYIISIGGKNFSTGISQVAKKVPGAMFLEIPLLEFDAGQEESIISAFTQIADVIEDKIVRDDSVGLLNAVAVVDFYDPSINKLSEVNPISSVSRGPSVLIGMLILAFPEIHWCINTRHVPLGSYLFPEFHLWDAIDHERSAERIFNLSSLGYTPLFDPTGLRNTIRTNIRAEEEGGVPVAPTVRVRPQLAAVIEEETAYAYLHAYTAYKFGFRVKVISSFGMMKRFLTEVPDHSAGEGACETGVALLFEDLYLNFADRNPDSGVDFSLLSQRDKAFPGLAKVRLRVIITTGHGGQKKDDNTRQKNDQYIKAQSTSGHYTRMIFKPGAGIFDTWKRSGLASQLPNGKAEGYELEPDARDETFIYAGHSAPGRLLVIADRLLIRSRHILRHGNSVTDSFYSALLALEAQEYLGERTPTTSFEALALKHECEAVAESAFYGVQYNIDLSGRFEELQGEIHSIGQWYPAKTKKATVFNAELRILTRLLGSFRQNGQFDEEQKALQRIRKINRSLWFGKNRAGHCLFWLPRWYVESLLGSVFNFVLALLGWLAFCFAIYFWLLHSQSSPEYLYADVLHALTDAFTVFLGMQPPHDFATLTAEYANHSSTAVAVTLTGISASFIHLGIFISHVYSLVSRR